jgi:PAS domain S-box-containing protein
VAVAAVLRGVLYAVVGAGLPFLTFFPAVIVAALYGGLGPGLLATALAALAACYWFQPVDSPRVATPTDVVGLALFAAVSLFIVWLCERSRRSDVRAGAALDAQARLAAVVESSDDAIVSKDLDGTVHSWNPAAERLFGYAPHEMIGRPITVIIPPDRRGEEDAIIDRVRRGEPIERYETVRVRKDGTPVEVSLTVSPVRDRGGRVIGASKIARPISDLRRAERRNRFLVKLHDATRPLADPDAITRTSARLLGEYLNVDRCAYADVEEDQDTFNLTGDYTRDGVPSIVGRYRLADFGAEVLRLHRQGKAYVVADVEADGAAQLAVRDRRPAGHAAVDGNPRRAPAAAGRARRPARGDAGRDRAEGDRGGARAAARGRACRPRGGRAREPHEGRVPRHAQPRAAHPAERDPRVVGAAARRRPRRRQRQRGPGGRAPGAGDDRAQRARADADHRGPARHEPHHLGQGPPRRAARVARARAARGGRDGSRPPPRPRACASTPFSTRSPGRVPGTRTGCSRCSGTC